MFELCLSEELLFAIYLCADHVYCWELFMCRIVIIIW
jgi:hypothetical protein